MNLMAPLNNTNIIVPNNSLLDDWIDPDYGYINIHKLKNVKPYVVNGYTMSNIDRNCSLLICDEVHRYARQDSKFFSTVLDKTSYNFCLCLSGSLTNEEREFLEERGIKKIGEVTQKEAELNGWISKSLVYNLLIELDEDTRESIDKLTKIHNSAFKKFNHDFNLARGCFMGKNKYYTAYKKGQRPMKLTGDQWRLQLAKSNGWDGNDEHIWSPKNIQNYAVQWNYSMQQRQKILFNYPEKIDLTVEILKKLDEISIVFSESIDFIEKVKSKLGDDARTYHSKLETIVYDNDSYENPIAVSCGIKGAYKMLGSGKFKSYSEIKDLYPKRVRLSGDKRKEKIKEDFKNEKFKWLLTVKSLDEGFDFKKVTVGITPSSKGVKRQTIQRDGRIIRSYGDKVAIIVNMACIDTQDEVWLTNRQKGIPKSKINWVYSVDQINKEQLVDDDLIIIEE